MQVRVGYSPLDSRFQDSQGIWNVPLVVICEGEEESGIPSFGCQTHSSRKILMPLIKKAKMYVMWTMDDKMVSGFWKLPSGLSSHVSCLNKISALRTDG